MTGRSSPTRLLAAVVALAAVFSLHATVVLLTPVVVATATAVRVRPRPRSSAPTARTPARRRRCCGAGCCGTGSQPSLVDYLRLGAVGVPLALLASTPALWLSLRAVGT